MKKQGFIRISKRENLSTTKAIGIRLFAVLLSLVVCGFVIYAMVKMNPLKVYEAMFDGAFGTSRKSWITIRDAMFLLIIAVGLAPAFKMRFWNIGAEGQVLVGGVATAACMIYFKALPIYVLLPLMMGCSAIAGALWGYIPATFKARFGTNETLFTLMMNYIAIQLTSFFVSLWENPPGSNSVGIINPIVNVGGNVVSGQEGWFPPIFGQPYMLNVIIVLAFAVIMFFYLRSSKQGYEISVVGSSINTARYAGINVKHVTIRTMAISGAICGIAGFIAVSGSSHTISTAVAGGNGFTAIIVAWLAKFNTFVMLLISFLLVFMEKGAIEIASQFQLNDFAAKIFTGIILFFILGCEFFVNYRVHLSKAKEGQA